MSRPVGARASLLLGMLNKPMTARELHAVVGRTYETVSDPDTDVALDDLFDDLPTLMDIKRALRALDDGGIAIVLRDLERLERHQYVQRITGAAAAPEDELWVRS